MRDRPVGEHRLQHFVGERPPACVTPRCSAAGPARTRRTSEKRVLPAGSRLDHVEEIPDPARGMQPPRSTRSPGLPIGPGGRPCPGARVVGRVERQLAPGERSGPVTRGIAGRGVDPERLTLAQPVVDDGGDQRRSRATWVSRSTIEAIVTTSKTVRFLRLAYERLTPASCHGTRPAGDRPAPARSRPGVAHRSPGTGISRLSGAARARTRGAGAAPLFALAAR